MVAGDFLTDKKNKTVLVIDPSSSHLAYSLASVEDKDLVFYQAGMLWTLDKWDSGRKFLYMFRALKELLNQEPVPDSVYSESYFVNFSRVMGMSSVPTVNNLIRMGIIEVDSSIGFSEISVSTWRKLLKIKGVPKKDGKKGKDFKVPTREAVDNLIEGTPIPEKIMSNITGNYRATPHDLSDCMAIAIAVGKKLGCNKFVTLPSTFTNPILSDKLKRMKLDVQ